MTEDGGRRHGSVRDPRPARLSHPQVLVALIGALGGVAVAAVTGGFTVLAGWVQLGQGDAAQAGPVPAVTVTAVVTTTVTVGETPAGRSVGPAQPGDPSPSETDVTLLSELSPIDEEGRWRDGEVRLEGQEFEHGMLTSTSACESYRTYSLGGKYQRFRTTAAFSDVTGGEESADLAVYADGVLVRSDLIVRGKPFAVDVDVNDADELQLYFGLCGSTPVLGLGDPRLLIGDE